MNKLLSLVQVVNVHNWSGLNLGICDGWQWFSVVCCGQVFLVRGSNMNQNGWKIAFLMVIWLCLVWWLDGHMTDWQSRDWIVENMRKYSLQLRRSDDDDVVCVCVQLICHLWLVCPIQVCLRSSPIYHIGAVGFTVSADGIPKVGQLMKAAWSMNDTCRFKIKTVIW